MAIEKSTATIAYNDSFFGGDEWKQYDNPDNDMDFQKCALAPNPTFPLSMRREKKTPIIDADNDDEIG
jgi:hypothetical protein